MQLRGKASNCAFRAAGIFLIVFILNVYLHLLSVKRLDKSINNNIFLSSFFIFGIKRKITVKSYNHLFSAAAPPRIAVLTTSSTLFRRYAPEQGT